jgi:tetratricopeptide (TPR) repeat protein
MDDQKVTELLELAGQEYNSAKYAEAIGHWQEVLAVDPENQKAREGIRMAKLLVVNWEAPEGEEGSQAASGSGGPVDAELQEKINSGIARIKELMAAGQLQEAVEGCQLLTELAPHLDSVKQLKEEVSHAFEAQPFINEHLERAKRLLGQGKLPDAVDEAKKVLSLDKNNQEAHGILNSAGATGPGDAATRPPSAFELESQTSPAPPSPFAPGDDLAEQFDLEESGPQPAVTPEPPATSPPPAAVPDAGAGDLDLDFGDGPEVSPTDVAPQPDSANEVSDNPEVQALITKGQQAFDAGQYNDAIDAWSHIYAVDQTNTQASALIDEARAKLQDIARQADESYYRAVDLFESGSLAEAQKEFEQVLVFQPDNADARSYLEQIASKLAGGEVGDVTATSPDAAPAAGPGDTPGAMPKAIDEEFDLSDAAAPDPDLVKAAASAPAAAPEVTGNDIGPAPALAPADDQIAVAPHPPSPPMPAQKPLPVSAGPNKRSKVAPPPPSGGGNNMVMIAVVAVVVLGGAAAGWYFLMGGSSGSGEPVDGPGVASASPIPAGNAGGGEPEEPAGSGSEESGDKAGGSGGIEMVPNSNPTPPPPPPRQLSPREIERKVASLMREGKSLQNKNKYAEAQARFDQAIALDPGNFEAEELRMAAVQGVAEEAKFNRELQASKDAFDDRDWGASLYKLYRLQEKKRGMTVLKRYIKNANYNWGLESMDYFDIDAAIEHFNDALEMAPANTTIKRAKEVATRYKRRRRDTAYNTFLAAQKPKALDEK